MSVCVRGGVAHMGKSRRQRAMQLRAGCTRPTYSLKSTNRGARPTTSSATARSESPAGSIACTDAWAVGAALSTELLHPSAFLSE